MSQLFHIRLIQNLIVILFLFMPVVKNHTLFRNSADTAVPESKSAENDNAAVRIYANVKRN